MSCAPAGDSEEKVEYYVSLLDSGKRLAYDYISAAEVVYKPVFFKPESSEGTAPIRFEKVRWESNWWLNPIKVDSKVQSLHIGKDSQLFMGDAEREEFEAVILLYDPNNQKIFSMTNPNQGLAMGTNGEAKMLQNSNSKYSVDVAN